MAQTTRMNWSWLLIFAALAFAFYGSRPLWEPDEGRYAETAREMLVHDQWLVPHLQGKAHLTKPPMTYWLSAIGMGVLGVDEWGARFFLSLAFFGTMLATVELALTWGLRRQVALTAGLMFGTSILPFVCGHVLTTDMILTFWETLGILCAWKVWRGAGHRCGWRMGFWLAFGLAFLTKGPPGLLPLLAVAGFTMMKRPQAPNARLRSWAGLALMLVVGGWWFALLIVRNPDLVQYFVKDEVVNRVLSEEHGRGKFPGFYVFVILVGLTPWIFLWPAMIRRTIRKLTPLRLATFCKMEDTRLFSLLWVMLPLIVFMIARSKMFFYVVPLFVPIAIWAAKVMWDWWPKGWPRQLRYRQAIAGVGGLWSLAMLIFLLGPEGISRDRSLKPLAQKMTELPRAIPERLYSIDDPPHSISFYTGRLIIDRDELRTSEKIRYYHGLAQAGENVWVLADDGSLEEVVEKGVPFELVTQSKELSVIRLLAGPQVQ